MPFDGIVFLRLHRKVIIIDVFYFYLKVFSIKKVDSDKLIKK